MPTRTVTNQQLTPDATYFVRGKIGFCRITRLTTDDERERANQSRVHPITRNYTTVTLYDAQVLAGDPNNPTQEEIYAAESMYKNKNPQERPGLNFSAINKSSRLPRIGVLSPTPTNPQNYKEIRPTAELAVGLDVTLVMRVFKGQGNNGVSLDRVLVNEPIRYYGGSDQVDRAMSQRGITFEGLPPENLVGNDPGAEPDPPAEDPEVEKFLDWLNASGAGRRHRRHARPLQRSRRRVRARGQRRQSLHRPQAVLIGTPSWRP